MNTNRIGKLNRTFAHIIVFIISYHCLLLFIKYLGRI